MSMVGADVHFVRMFIVNGMKPGADSGVVRWVRSDSTS